MSAFDAHAHFSIWLRDLSDYAERVHGYALVKVSTEFLRELESSSEPCPVTFTASKADDGTTELIISTVATK